MDFERFEKMSKAEAAALLQEFLTDGRANVDIVRAHAERAGVNANYSLETLPDLLKWALTEVKTIPLPPDPVVPEYIRANPEYEKARFNFDDRSGNLVVFVAYYLGECFIQRFSHLRWASGNRRTFKQNMPVVTGFLKQIELAPMLVVENVFARVIRGASGVEAIDTMVSSWRTSALASAPSYDNPELSDQSK